MSSSWSVQHPAVMMFRPVEKCDQSPVSTMAASIEAACVTKKRIGWRSETRQTQSRHECRMHHQSAERGGACGHNCRRARSARKASSDIEGHISVTGPLPSKATLRGRSARPCYRLFFFENRSPYPPISSFSINSIPACSKAACILTNVEA
jgi:hypothetical protein